MPESEAVTIATPTLAVVSGRTLRNLPSIGVAIMAGVGAALRLTLVQQRARLVVLAALGAYFGLLAGMGGHSKWTKIGVPAAYHWFDDLRNVTAAWDCTRQHLPVLPTNSCDPEGRPANYPRLWLLPHHLGLGLGDTHWLGWVIAALFLAAAVAVVPKGAGIWTGVLYSVTLCSAAAML